jgi:hypothetical protein
MSTGYLFEDLSAEHDVLSLRRQAKEVVREVERRLRQCPRSDSRYHVFLCSRMNRIPVNGICSGERAFPYFLKVHTLYGWHSIQPCFRLTDSNGYVFLEEDSPVYEMDDENI